MGGSCSRSPTRSPKYRSILLGRRCPPAIRSRSCSRGRSNEANGSPEATKRRGMIPFDLLDLDPVERAIITYLLRHGATETEQLADALDQLRPDIERAVGVLAAGGLVARSDGTVHVDF